MGNRPGKDVWKADPLPRGPYVLVHQDNVEYFKKNYLSMTHEFIQQFEIKWGFFTYAVNPMTGDRSF